MLSHLRAKCCEQCVERCSTAASAVVPTNSALFAQHSGFSNLANMSVARQTVFLLAMSGSRSSSSMPSTSSTPLASLTPLLPSLSSLPIRDQPMSDAERAAADQHTVVTELHHYKEDGIIVVDGNHPIDLLQFWEVCRIDSITSAWLI